MKPSRLSFIALLIVLFLAGWWFWKSKQVKPAEPQTAGSANTPASSGTTNQPSASNTNPAPSSHAGVLARLAEFQAAIDEANGRSLDFYGKVIDQYSQPVIGAKVKGYVMTEVGFDGSKETLHLTQTDAEGNFEFLGLHGESLGVGPEKEGYQFVQRGNGNWSSGHKTDPNNRTIFHMWKVQGAEPMVHTTIQAGIACDGTARNFDLLSGRRDAGNLIATLTRNPVNIDRGKPFDWTLTLSIPEGGLVAITDAYPNEAPASGYQTVSIHMSADTRAWSPSAEQSYYLYDGKYYGRVTVNIMADYQPPPTHIEFEAFINPSSSRNLEFDSTQAIKP